MQEYPSIPRATRQGILRAKAKTQAWLDRVVALHGDVAGRRLIES